MNGADLVKYPRTYHLPFSLGATDDDKILKDYSYLEGKLVVVTEKMDGENTTLYRTRSHARSVDSRSHPSRDWLKKFHASFAYEIPEDWRICGENLFAKHSIHYKNLKSYFYGFSVWEGSRCLGYADTLSIFDYFKIVPAPELISPHIFDEKRLIDLSKKVESLGIEGFVVRTVDGFEYDDFHKCVAKYVRKNHVQTNDHWMQQEIVQNEMAN